jgi:hypothetical protein
MLGLWVMYFFGFYYLLNTSQIRGLVKREVYLKIGISEMDILEIGCISDTSDDVISDMSISDRSMAKNGHIGLDILEI